MGGPSKGGLPRSDPESGPSRKYVTMSPLPLTDIVPRHSSL